MQPQPRFTALKTLAQLVAENDRATALDTHHGAIAKLDRHKHGPIKLRKDLCTTYHVVGGLSIEVPPLQMLDVFIHGSEEHLRSWLF